MSNVLKFELQQRFEPQNIERFAQTAAELISAIDTKAFSETLDATIQQLVPFDFSATVAYPADGPVVLLHDGLVRATGRRAWKTYLAGAYLLDPIYTACRHNSPRGLYRISDLAPDAYFDADYYNSVVVHPCISMEQGSLAEEVVFISPVGVDTHICYSLMRSTGNSAFTNEEMSALGRIEPVVRAVLAKHFKKLTHQGPAVRGNRGLERTFETFAADVLSKREQTVVSLILRGHSSASISAILEIANGTVKNHRKTIYSKLTISSQSELFALFVDHILKQVDLPLHFNQA